jgi:hypothetical protein
MVVSMAKCGLNLRSAAAMQVLQQHSPGIFPTITSMPSTPSSRLLWPQRLLLLGELILASPHSTRPLPQWPLFSQDLTPAPLSLVICRVVPVHMYLSCILDVGASFSDLCSACPKIMGTSLSHQTVLHSV